MTAGFVTRAASRSAATGSVAYWKELKPGHDVEAAGTFEVIARTDLNTVAFRYPPIGLDHELVDAANRCDGWVVSGVTPMGDGDQPQCRSRPAL